jgi:uncharacterized protein (DUF58 family)
VKISDGSRIISPAFAVEDAMSEIRSDHTAEWHGPGAPDRRRRGFKWSVFLWSLVFPQRGHRVLPTASGIILFALSMGIGTAAYNSSNNILFIALSLLLTCLILSGVLSWLNLMGVAWRLQLAPPFRAGKEAAIGLEVRNAKKFLPTYGLWFNLVAQAIQRDAPAKAESTLTARGIDVRAVLAKAGRVEASSRLVLRERLDPRGGLRLDWMFRPTCRGALRVELEGVGSLFPFGFLKKQIGTDLSAVAMVWPASVEYRRFPVAAARRPENGEEISRAGAGGDLLALRRYAPGDSHRLIHWKASARTRQLLVRQFSAESIPRFSLWLGTDAGVWTRPEQFELLVSFAGTLAEDLFRTGQLIAVAINDERPVPVRRLRDLELFLDRLAEVERVGTGSRSPFAEKRRSKNILMFAPDGARGVAAYVDGEKTASA